MNEHNCQINNVVTMSDPMEAIEILWQRQNRLKRILKRRWRFLGSSFSKIIGAKQAVVDKKGEVSSLQKLLPGDLVRVRSREEIEATLDNWNQLKRCSFVEEMVPYCNTTQRVFKRVEKFLDERDYLMKKTNSIVILQNVFCEGAKDFGACDRTCFYFWREEWLEKIVPDY